MLYHGHNHFIYYYYQTPLKAFAEIGLQLRLHRLLFERSPFSGQIPGPCVAETDDQAVRGEYN